MSCPVCKKVNISEESYKEMMNIGMLSTSIENWNAVLECFDKTRQLSGSTSEAVKVTCEQTGVCRTDVYKIIAKFR